MLEKTRMQTRKWRALAQRMRKMYNAVNEDARKMMADMRTVHRRPRMAAVRIK